MIGEAAARLSDETRVHLPEIPWKQIIGFRNIAVHAYFSVDWRIVFVTVTDDLPPMKERIVERLGQSK